MVMGRGSDTRIYAPRSESSNMYSSANEDEDKYNPASPEFNEQRAEKKKLKEEAKKERRSKIKHIKISSKQPLSGEESPAGIDDGNKRDDEREMGLQGGPAGSRGTLLDLATGAKSGTGSAMSPGLPIAMSEPMEDAWSELLKRDTPKTIAARRRRESRRQFRPSTGQFKTPPGGMSGGVGATKRRHAARMRGISSGKKTGLMKPHLSVEMSHRGIATKQPMSKDPQRYNAYRGQSEARKIQGNVRTSFSPRGRFGQRSFTAGPTGAGRLSGLLAGQRGQMRQPALRQIGIRRPRIRRPRAPPMPSMPQMPMPQSSVPSMPAPPSSIMMSEDAQVYSELLKAKNIVQRFELLNLMRRLIQAKEKEAKIKKYVQGGGSAFEDGHVPDHPAGVQQHEDEEEKNDGPTQNLETNSSRLGLDPANALISRRGHMG